MILLTLFTLLSLSRFVLYWEKIKEDKTKGIMCALTPLFFYVIYTWTIISNIFFMYFISSNEEIVTRFQAAEVFFGKNLLDITMYMNIAYLFTIIIIICAIYLYTGAILRGETNGTSKL